ncbi:hypothetical protein CDL15_Pgr018955 [Punica granatum]|nr:hypothetical protein CDL15_Pgr018955 [Punica granatum]PKI50180.1 hypothetical protein CRG98_029424 [Punica granatum]
MEAQVVSSIKGSHPHTSVSTFPILTIVIASITVTAILLVGYWALFIARCCSNGPRLGLISGWICCIFQSPRGEEDSFIALSPAAWASQGLDGTSIHEIPAFHFVRGEANTGGRINFSGCAVCLNEFQERDVLRALPNCSHAFHSDCIDIWLRGNANCPLCRTGILGSAGLCTDNDYIVAPSSSPQDCQSYPDSLLGGDENFVVIELMGREDAIPHDREAERNCSREEQSRSTHKLKHKSFNGSSMGDECIDIMRDEQDESSSMVQPMIRRSFSLDSAADRHLYLSVQAAVQGKNRGEVSGSSEGRNGKVRRSLFSFSHGRRSRNAVQPLNFKL